MREKELRIALVCFGGISLAVYMHGVTKEILKLVRASRALHDIPNRAARDKAEFADDRGLEDRAFDTEAIYFELLREIGRDIDLRVIVDVIAGASAGGINGIMLARALAHDLSMDRMRDLWLDRADVSELIARPGRLMAGIKSLLFPFIWAGAQIGFHREIGDPDFRRALWQLSRSNWFKPPFDGARMSDFMLDAIRGMGAPTGPEASLLPVGQQLDLFVTVTDFSGYQRRVEIHDPPTVRDREHRHVLRFGYRRFPNGETETDFDLEGAPGLTFAARATSAFPGAFPPLRIDEIDQLLILKGLGWPNRKRFVERNFQAYAQAGADAEAAFFIDGSVLNNKPFSEALSALSGRPAHRDIDRRLVYIDPDPERLPSAVTGRAPGMFTTLKGAMSDIPRNQTIADELASINDANVLVRRLNVIINDAQAQIPSRVADLADEMKDRPLTAQQVREWRETAMIRAASESGVAFEGYARLRLSGARLFVSEVIIGLCGFSARSPHARTVTDIIFAWMRQSGIIFAQGDSHALRLELSDDSTDLPPWVRFLFAFDIEVRRRRLHYLVLGLTRLYQKLDDVEPADTTEQAVRRLRQDLYHSLDVLRRHREPEFFSLQARTMARELFVGPSLVGDDRQTHPDSWDIARRNLPQISTLIARLATETDLVATTTECDRLIAGMDPGEWLASARQEVIVNYLSFPFWDVLTSSIANWRNSGEFEEIKVNRISPEDARTFRSRIFAGGPKGTGLGHFGAFFSRVDRENDYLLGRLHAIDRLIDLVCDSAGIDARAGRIDVAALKRRAFETILTAEADHLPRSAALMAQMRQAVDRMEPDG